MTTTTANDTVELTPGMAKVLAGLVETRDQLRAELAAMSFASPKRAYRVFTLAAVVRRIRDITGE